ncbi:MAG TPA: nuclear transport factor 2 family protein [Actinomycetota bacterium]|nr:nuclear transport factor 2 family protein [Actinomycetota bacterium]
MIERVRAERDPAAVIDRLVHATNEHDLDALVGCFDDGYANEAPAHPQRGFRGSEQVRRNWTRIFSTVPDIRAQVLRRTVDGDTVWTEWEMSGTRRDGTAFLMRGVIIFGVVEATVTSARFYLEPVEDTSGDVNAAVNRAVGSSTAGARTRGGRS